MKYLLFLFLVLETLLATPQTFKEYGESYVSSKEQLQSLKNHPYFKPYVEMFRYYETAIDDSFSVGYQLDNAIATKNGECAGLKKAYLKALRGLESKKVGIENIYVQALNYAMKNDDIALFKVLIKAPMQPLYLPRIQRKVVAYYKRQKALKRIKLLDNFSEELQLEKVSRMAYNREKEVYEEHLNVIKAEEAARLRLMTADKRTRNVIVSTHAFDGGYHFQAENLNAYEVTIELVLNQINNFTPSLPLPLVVELKAGEKRNILDVVQQDKRKKAWFKSHFSWAMGSYSAQHDDSYIYTLPFQKGQKVYISQGYHGAATHKGLSAYAIDFPVVEGTPIHAARSGKVVATKSDSTEGGFSKQFRSKANYVVIEHADRTLGKYYHLKYQGVSVKVGDKVAQGDLIGYSGNTGYSSGPHLHFSVSKVDAKTYRRAKTIPTIFKTQEGLLKNAKRGQSFIVI